MAKRIESEQGGVGLAQRALGWWRERVPAPVKRLLWTLAKYVLGLGLLAYMVWDNWAPPGRLGLANALQKPLQPVPLALAVAICTASVLLTFIRWHVLVRAQELTFSLFNALRLGLIGFFWSTFLPGSVGGDIVKAAFIARDQSRRTVAVATVVIDRVVGLWGLFWLVALLGGGFWLAGDEELHGSPFLQWVLAASWAIVLGSVVSWLLLGALPTGRAERFAGWLERRIPKVGHSVAELWRAVWMYRLKRGAIALALAMSLVGHVGFVLTFYYAAQVFLPPEEKSSIPTMAEHFLLVPVGMTIEAGFPSPGGVGGGEAAFGWLYELAGKDQSAGVLGTLTRRAIMWALAFVGYLVYLRMRPSLPVLDPTAPPAAVAAEPSADGAALPAAASSPTPSEDA